MENLDVQMVRPPVAIRVSAGAARERAFACVISLCIHVSLRSCSVIFFGLFVPYGTVFGGAGRAVPGLTPVGGLFNAEP
jgi:hypothetical protein